MGRFFCNGPCSRFIVYNYLYMDGCKVIEIKKRLNQEAVEYNRLDGLFKEITKDFPFQAHDYMIIESESFKGRILDVGSGPGIFAIVAKLKNPKLDITCMDGSSIHTEIGKILANKCGTDIGFDNFTLEEHGYKSKWFDTIVLNHVMEHIKDLDMVFDRCKELLRPGGAILIAVPYLNSHWSPNHVHFFDVEDKFKNTINLVKFFKKRKLKADIRIFDEEQIDSRHPNLSREQLDMYIEVKNE